MLKLFFVRLRRHSPRQFKKGGTVPMKYGSFSGMGRLEQAELQKSRGD